MGTGVGSSICATTDTPSSLSGPAKNSSPHPTTTAAAAAAHIGARRREPRTVALKQDAEPVYFFGLAVTDAGDDTTAPGFDHDEPVSLQLPQCLAHRRATDIEFGADFSFLEAIAGGEFAAHDLLPQSGIGFVYGCSHRVSRQGGSFLVYQTWPEWGKPQQDTRWVH